MRKDSRSSPPGWPRRFYSAGKRLFDLTFACLALVLLAPLFAVIALLMWLDSPGPVFFRQRRVGHRGKLFTIYKFRTMYADASAYDHSPCDDGRDDRVTRMGCVLRKTGLDELPQLVNVLRGQMSLVGPRPEMPFLVRLYNSKQRRRLDVLPGITGLWQISPARSEPIHDNLRYDYYYVRRSCFALDLAIIGSTLLVMLRGFGSRVAGPRPAEAVPTVQPAPAPSLADYAARLAVPHIEASRDPLASLEAAPKS